MKTIDIEIDIDGQQLALLKTLIDLFSDGIVVYNAKGKILMMNRPAEILDGVQAAEIVGLNYQEAIAKGVFDRSVVPDVIKSKKPASVLCTVRGNKSILVTGTPAFDGKGNISLIVVNLKDMTELNSVYRQLENVRLVSEKYRDELTELQLIQSNRSNIIAKSQEMKQVLTVTLKLAYAKIANILILGESGTGKGLLAKFFHQNCFGGEKPFIQINCAAIPENLLEAELFGYEKGAFTGAGTSGKAGLFALADGGTLFLDEIGEMPLYLQAKLLKYLDDHEVRPLGSTDVKIINCTIIAATNQNVNRLIKKKLFRKDLFYRLNGFKIEIPPLRERPEDIFELINHYTSKYIKQYRVNYNWSTKAMDMLLAHSFPGNVRELKNIIKRCVVMGEDPIFTAPIENSFGVKSRSIPRESYRGLKNELMAVEKEIFKKAKQNCESLGEIARYLNISKPTACRRMKKYGLTL